MYYFFMVIIHAYAGVTLVTIDECIGVCMVLFGA